MSLARFEWLGANRASFEYRNRPLGDTNGHLKHHFKKNFSPASVFTKVKANRAQLERRAVADSIPAEKCAITE